VSTAEVHTTGDNSVSKNSTITKKQECEHYEFLLK